jgi:hypothetical protein
MTTTTYAADRTALLIVDPYNDFMSEGGKFYEAIRKTAEAVGDGRTGLGQLHHFVTRAACTLWRPACRGAVRGGQWTALAVGMAVALAASPGQALHARGHDEPVALRISSRRRGGGRDPLLHHLSPSRPTERHVVLPLRCKSDTVLGVCGGLDVSPDARNMDAIRRRREGRRRPIRRLAIVDCRTRGGGHPALLLPLTD